MKATDIDGADAVGFMGAERGAEFAAADPHSLDADEAGALNVYTMESEVYPTINQKLRQRDRQVATQCALKAVVIVDGWYQARAWASVGALPQMLLLHPSLIWQYP